MAEAEALPDRVDTDRLLLRPMPAAAAAALPRDRDVAADVIGVALDDEWPQPDVIDIIPSQANAEPDDLRFGVWLVIERATSSVIGDIGFMGRPAGEGTVEIGYSVVPSRRGRGYATEAVRALVAWAFRLPLLDAVLATTDADNTISQRVLERAGFQRTGSDDDQVRWRLDRSVAER